MPSRPSSQSPSRHDDRRKRRRVSLSRSPDRSERHRGHARSHRSEHEESRHEVHRASRHSRNEPDDTYKEEDRSSRHREDHGRSRGSEARPGQRRDLREKIVELGAKQALPASDTAVQEEVNATTAPVAAPAAVDLPRKAPAKGRAGGVYVPPWKQAQLAAAMPQNSELMERQTWDALRKSLNGHINKVTAQNIRSVIRELLRENVVRGKGLLCRSLMRSQMASPTFTPVYAAVAAVLNNHFPDIVALLLHRLVQQFKRSYRRNDKNITGACLKFLAHLTNQQVVTELLVLEMIVLMLDLRNLTDDSVEMALGVFKEIGQYMDETTPAALQDILDTFRRVLQEGTLEQRTRFLVEGMLLQHCILHLSLAEHLVGAEDFLQSASQARDRFKDFPRIPEGLDLVHADEQRTHNIELEENYPVHVGLDVFKHDDNWQAQDNDYKEKAAIILGSDSDDEDSGDEEGSDDSAEDSSEEEADDDAPQGMKISDMTETNLVNLRRTIYLTIMSSMSFEEAGHKLVKIELAPGQEIEVVTMLIECCSQEKTYLKYYGHVAQRFCEMSREYQALFEECFQKQYMLIHRLETNKLRNVARMFAHLLATGAISWEVLRVITVTEDETTSSSRIFIKILFQDLSENMGMALLNERMQDPAAAMWFQGIFPHDTPRNIRFSINFFTSIGLGGLTDKMRLDLAEMPKAMKAAQQAAAAAAASDDSSSDDSSDSSSSSDDSSSGSSSSDSSSDDSPPPQKRGSDSRRRSSKHAGHDVYNRSNGHLPPPPPMPQQPAADTRRMKSVARAVS